MSFRMYEDRLISAVRARAHDPATRTDRPSERHCEIPAPATAEAIQAAEGRMGFPLQSFHRRLLQEIGDGGFGPGDGLVGVVHGLDAHGRSLLALRDVLWLDAETPLPAGVVPLCDWGDAIWSCVDAKTDHVLTFDESDLTDTRQNIYSWFDDWVSGVNLFGKMFVLEERVIVNPFTKQLMTVRTPASPVGAPYKPSG
ncbi:SMI1/KNR4 family protein [Sorangium sp. So ce216]